MKIVPAKSFDIPTIMQIERSAFIPEIQENQRTFENRLSAFPDGFLLLQDCTDETVLKNGHSVTAGYFCSEIWPSLPASDDFFALGHNPSKIHTSAGPVLYASSFALFPAYRGNHLAKPFFNDCLSSICSQFPGIKTVLLLVNTEWAGAEHIYKSLGFEKLRIIPGFFPGLHGEKKDGVLMTADASLFRQ